MTHPPFRPVLALAAALLAGASPTLAAGAPMPAPIVFFDIAGPDVPRLTAFYEAVFGWSATPDKPFPDAPYLQPLPVTSPLPAGLRRTDPSDDPQVRKVLYIGVEDITATLAQVTAHGGTVQTPRFEVKGVVVLALFRDPAGNVMGLVETKDGKPKIP